MNRKGESIMGLILGLLVFLVLWAMFFASWINEWTHRFIEAQSLTGLDAFLIANMNLWILGGLIIGLVVIYYGGSS